MLPHGSAARPHVIIPNCQLASRAAAFRTAGAPRPSICDQGAGGVAGRVLLGSGSVVVVVVVVLLSVVVVGTGVIGGMAGVAFIAGGGVVVVLVTGGVGGVPRLVDEFMFFWPVVRLTVPLLLYIVEPLVVVPLLTVPLLYVVDPLVLLLLSYVDELFTEPLPVLIPLFESFQSLLTRIERRLLVVVLVVRTRPLL